MDLLSLDIDIDIDIQISHVFAMTSLISSKVYYTIQIIIIS